MKETAANNQIEGHRRTRYFEQSPNIPSNFTICHICHLTCSSGNTLKAHMRINHCERNIACEFCEKKCMDKRGLTVHISKTHKKPPTR